MPSNVPEANEDQEVTMLLIQSPLSDLKLPAKARRIRCMMDGSPPHPKPLEFWIYTIPPAGNKECKRHYCTAYMRRSTGCTIQEE